MLFAISFGQLSLCLPLSNLPHTCAYPLHVHPLHIGSPEVPYVSFMGTNLPNNSYVDLTQVGTGENDSVHCHTDLQTCCNGTQGAHRGDWYFPDGMRLQFNGDGGDIYEFRYDQQVDLRRRNNSDTSGIYCCAVDTNAVHSDVKADTTTRETVCAGLYASGGECACDSIDSVVVYFTHQRNSE